MYKVKIQRKAIISITNTVECISKDNIFYANQVQEYIYKSIKLLGNFPLLGIDIGEGYRKIVESKYRFKIIYKIKKDIIYVVGVYKYQNTWK